jgi:RNA-directed DNA polymerase
MSGDVHVRICERLGVRSPRATRLIMCFQYREDAQRMLRVLHQRFARYGLSLHPDKTRLLEFGCYAQAQARRRGERKPETFDFPGFTHLCARSRRGHFTVHVKTQRKKVRRSLMAISQWCQRNRHRPAVGQRRILNAKLRGRYQYYGRPTNYRSLWQFYRGVRGLRKKWLTRRTRGKTLTWAAYAELLNRHPLLRPYIYVRNRVR